MISTFTAFIDANVFYGARLRSLMLFCAQTKLFRARWSQKTTEEWVRNLLTNRPDLIRADLETTVSAMNEAVPDCMVENFEALEEGIDLPDLNDRHVVAAAIVANASVIVTFNVSDFPPKCIEQYRLSCVHPDQFLIDLYHVSTEIFIEAVKADFNHYRKPPLAYAQYLEALSRAGAPQITRLLEPYKVLMD